MRSRELIDSLGLQPHPEGGWYREVFRSSARVAPADGRPRRDALTTIYFLLEAGQHSRWHRVSSDEVWVHVGGDALALYTCDAALRTAPAHIKLGPVDMPGFHPQHVVPAGQWQAARPITKPDSLGYCLTTCTVGPGFDFDDFSFMAQDSDEAAAMRHHWPELADLI
ncbi:cupin domain-containing protein [Variovorax dokdonensis]|uniref:Cupin domain-containing protein n=1 Tax=Variovorax dokdonensis TaxID=344883 RepID=A0ABT7NBF8_9BURK|nr:cupin domain-containing protein [Variovorax dokdonensis]MDM0045269.1 cupin domain-containing protein [Variovorax dokdonensis]